MVIRLRLLLSYVWTHTGISTKSRVPITYVIRQTVSLHGERQYETVFQIQNFCQKELWYFLYYSSNDHDLSCQLHGAHVRLTSRRQHSGLISIIMNSWPCPLEPQCLSSLNGSDEPRTPLASPSDSRVLATWAQLGVVFATPWCLGFSVVLRANFAAWAPPSANLTEH